MGVKISNLPAIVAPALSDVFPVAQGGVTYKETITQLATLLNASGSVPSFTSPTIANHIAVFTNTAGNLGENAATAINGGNIQAGLSGTAGYLSSFPGTAARGSLRIVGAASAGDTITTITNASMGQVTTVTVPDPGASTANFILSNSALGQDVSAQTASATSSFASLRAEVIATTPTLTSGVLAGTQGTSSIVGTSGGIVAGVLGVAQATGTLSGPSIFAGIYSSLNLGGSTINGGRVAAVAGGWSFGATTTTDMSKTNGFYFNNPTANVLNSQICLGGDAQYALEVSGATTFVATPGGVTPSGNVRTLKVYINGAAYYILAAAVYS